MEVLAKQLNGICNPAIYKQASSISVGKVQSSQK